MSLSLSTSKGRKSLSRTFGAAALFAGLAFAPIALAGTVSTFTVTGDADSQISSTKTYTAKADPGGDAAGAAVINGVTFDVGTPTGTASAATYTAPGLTYTSAGAFNFTSHPGNANDLPASGGIRTLLTDMVYSGTSATTGAGNVTTLTFTGLTPGTGYSARIYYRAWDAATARTSTINFDEDGAGPLGASAGAVDEDAPNSAVFDNVANVIAYDYIATDSTMAVTFNQVAHNNSWHLYGATNEVAPVPEPATLGLLALGVTAGLARRRRAQ